MLRRDLERGQTLIELLIGVAITVTLAAVGAFFVLGSHQYAHAKTVMVLTSLIDQAHAQGSTSGNGSTVTMKPDGGGGILVTVYDGRPIPGSVIPGSNGSANTVDLPFKYVHLTNGSNVMRSEDGPISIFVSSSGAATASVWSPSDGALSSEPLCVDPMTLVIQDDDPKTTRTISCGNARLR